jgi:hypothetical protein
VELWKAVNYNKLVLVAACGMTLEHEQATVEVLNSIQVCVRSSYDDCAVAQTSSAYSMRQLMAEMVATVSSSRTVADLALFANGVSLGPRADDHFAWRTYLPGVRGIDFADGAQFDIHTAWILG